MRENSLSTPTPTAVELPRLRYFSRSLLLLVYLPLFHTVLATSVMLSSGVPAWVYVPDIALRLWIVSTLIFSFVNLLELGPIPKDSQLTSAQFILKYFVVLIPCLMLMGLLNVIFLGDQRLPTNTAQIGPLVVASLEILLIAALRAVLKQQQINHALEVRYRNAQHHALRAQLNPHFLFNTLNMISSEIEHDPKLATELIDKFSDLLRGALNATERPMISLAEELELLERYLEIQQNRFGARLQYEIERNSAASAISVPPMLLQPLVENAIKHGIAPCKKGGKVVVTPTIVDDGLQITISDDGRGFDQETVAFGRGLELVRDSVQLLYADNSDHSNSRFRIVSTPNEGALVTLRLPILTQPAGQLG